MKHTFKRIIALAIVLCTVGAMLVPGVSVATAVAGDITTYSINANAHSSLGFGTSASKAGSDCYWFHNSGYHNWTVMTENYASGALNWKVEAHSITQARMRTTYATIQSSKDYDTTLRFFAFRIKSPGAGNYSVNIRHRAENTGINTVTVYLFDAPETAFTNYSSSSNQGTLHPYMIEYVKSHESLLTFSAYADTAGTKTETGAKTAAVGDGDLLIVFGMQNVGKDDATNYPTFQPMDIYLVEQEIVAPTDYTVTYHANYEGAEVTAKADADNALGATDPMKSITVDGDVFNRPGYFTFAGWATTPDGEVVYRPGDEIVLKHDAPTVDLYAVWVEVWNPANNADLTVNFETALTNAGIAPAKNQQYWSDGTLATGLDAAYETNKWTVYRNNAGTVVYSTYPPRFYAVEGKLQFYASGKVNTETFAISKFVAPGTGDYKLSLDVGVVSSAERRADLAGAYIIPYGEYTKYNALTYVGTTGAVVLNAEQLVQVKSHAAAEAVSLVGGEEYLLVFFVMDSADGKGKADFKGFKLTEVKPAATIGTTKYEVIDAALAAAVAGDTLTLHQDVTAGEIDMDGFTIDLNGNTLTAEAVVGTVIDSKDGAGRLAVERDAVIITSGEQIALWDSTTGAEGYRIFDYTFRDHNPGVTQSKDEAVTALEKTIDFYDYERRFLAKTFDDNGEVAKGAGDYKYYQTLDHGNTVLQQIAADYAAGKTPWRYEYTSQQYQMGRGGLCFNWGAKSIRHFGNGYSAVRIQAPGAGDFTIALDTCSNGDPTVDGAFDLYIVQASGIESLCTDYTANYAAFTASPAAAVDETAAAFSAVMENSTPVITGVSDGNRYTGSYTFEAGVEYILIFNNNGSIKNGLHMNFQNIQFNRAAKEENSKLYFWAQLAFTSEKAYTLAGDSGLKVGCKLTWNDGGKRDERFETAIIKDWAARELANPDKDYGFFIGVNGFEKVQEAGDLKVVFYIISSANIEDEAAAITYRHNP